MNVPIPDEGPVKDAMVTQGELDLLLDDYYRSRGWTANGIPTKSQLSKLGMDDLSSIIEGKEAKKNGKYS